MGDPHDDAWEYQERNRPPGNSDWDHWDKTLLRGMQSGDGLTLSRDQCWAVLKLLRYGRPKKQGERRSIKHPHDEGSGNRPRNIAFCWRQRVIPPKQQ
jgi:hypothetical protein